VVVDDADIEDESDWKFVDFRFFLAEIDFDSESDSDPIMIMGVLEDELRPGEEEGTRLRDAELRRADIVAVGDMSNGDENRNRMNVHYSNAI